MIEHFRQHSSGCFSKVCLSIPPASTRSLQITHGVRAVGVSTTDSLTTLLDAVLARLSLLRLGRISVLTTPTAITRGSAGAINELGRDTGGVCTVAALAADATDSVRLALRENGEGLAEDADGPLAACAARMRCSRFWSTWLLYAAASLKVFAPGHTRHTTCWRTRARCDALSRTCCSYAAGFLNRWLLQTLQRTTLDIAGAERGGWGVLGGGVRGRRGL